MAARPISLDASSRDARAELAARLQDVPHEHAEALLAACEVLQLLHDRGVLEFMRGLLGSSDEVLEIAVGAAKRPESIRTIRNGIVLMKLLGSIDPERLAVTAQIVPPVIESFAQRPKPQGLLRLACRWLWDGDLRYALSTLQNVAKTLGQSLRRFTK